MATFLEQINKIEEIDVPAALYLVDDEVEFFEFNVKAFVRNLSPECTKMAEMIKDENIEAFSHVIHAVKSMLATIGAKELSETAQKLESAAKEKNADYCFTTFPPFLDKLTKLYEKLDGIEY
jgi:HPt (histidine-containing phosphotransfer) domain-containing protein